MKKKLPSNMMKINSNISYKIRVFFGDHWQKSGRLAIVYLAQSLCQIKKNWHLGSTVNIRRDTWAFGVVWVLWEVCTDILMQFCYCGNTTSTWVCSNPNDSQSRNWGHISGHRGWEIQTNFWGYIFHSIKGSTSILQLKSTVHFMY